jgi:hypothetical protein
LGQADHGIEARNDAEQRLAMALDGGGVVHGTIMEHVVHTVKRIK